MNQPKINAKLPRLRGAALAANADGSLSLAPDGCAFCARVCAPFGRLPEREALEALADFCRVETASGLRPSAAAATPDLHPNTPIPVGSALATPREMAVPMAIGKDINCGMRLVRFGLPLEEGLERLDALCAALRGPLLEGRRDIPLEGRHFAALFEDGPQGLARLDLPREGLWRSLGRAELEQALGQSPSQALLGGASRFAPQALLADRLIRDPGLGTLGSGNHFLELQRLDARLDPGACWRFGMDAGSLYALIHTGSRDVGQFVGSRWMDAARAQWPRDRKRPQSGLFAIEGALAFDYVEALSAAAHYAWLNRALLQEMARAAISAALGREVSATCVADVPHNVVLPENGLNVHRKGATPARAGDLCLIPGSMGDHSYAAVGLGSPAALESCSHGSGRAARRSAASRMGDASKLPFRIETLDGRRASEERPAAYMDIAPAIEVQRELGMIAPAARFAPLATFKA